MPFEPLETIAAPMKDVQASISYRRNDTKHGASKNPKLVIGLPKQVCACFKPKETQKFTLQIGTGTDAGKARIVPSAAGGVTCRLLKGRAVFRFGFVPMLGSDACDKDFVNVRSIKEGFEIDLPAWFKAD